MAIGSASRAHVDERLNQLVAAIAAYLEEVSQRGIIRLGRSAPAVWVVFGIIERAIHDAVTIDPDADINQLAKWRPDFTGFGRDG